jgi:hypothetical protein
MISIWTLMMRFGWTSDDAGTILTIITQDEDWGEEERAHQGFTAEEFGALSEMLGPRGINFDNDDEPVPDEIDFAGDPVLEVDITVRTTSGFGTRATQAETDHGATWCCSVQAHIRGFLKDAAARDSARFSQVVDQLNADETVLVRQALAS